MVPLPLPPGLQQTTSIKAHPGADLQSAEHLSNATDPAIHKPPGLFGPCMSNRLCLFPVDTGLSKPHAAEQLSPDLETLTVQDTSGYKAAPGPQASYTGQQALLESPPGRSKQADPAELAEGQVLHLCLQ